MASLELRLDYDSCRLAWHDVASGQTTDQITVPRTGCGCSMEEFRLSPSGTWIVTSRWSGQGEWGYDVIRSQPLQHVGGIPEKRGYILDLPEFSKDESYILGGYGESWLGGWWCHPDDDFYETPSRGGVMTVGWLFRHCLSSQQVTFHELQMNLPRGWMPDDPEDEMWMGPRAIAPTEDGGFEMLLPGQIPFSWAGPLPEVIDLPAIQTGGGQVIE